MLVPRTLRRDHEGRASARRAESVFCYRFHSVSTDFDRFKPVGENPEVVAVSFDLFGTLVDADLPEDPASAIAEELRARDVAVPDDWAAAYRETHVDTPEGAVVPLMAHVSAALARDRKSVV